MNKTPTTLIIMDGFGLSDEVKGNAVRGANTPVLDRLNGEYAHTQLSASGLDVGLPAGQMGNSEVGHTNIGGGRVVFQDLPRISRAIEDGTFFENPAYNAAMDACLEKGTALHLYGLLSNGGVHSTVEHVWALLKMAGIKGLKRVYLHCFLDGRDVSPTSGADFVAEAQKKCAELGVGKIATVMGRYYAMDRDKRWDRLERAYDAMVYGEGIQNPDPVAAIRESYQNGVTDEFVEPVVCDKEGTISDNDAIIFFNYRPDRAREITRAFVDPAFDGFQREYFPVTYVCNTEYDATMPNVLVAFPRITIHNGLGEYLSKLGLTQLRIAETEKYAHVTFFFNGGVEAQLCQLRHGRSHRQLRRRRQGRRDRGRVRRQGRGRDAQDGRHRHDHRRPRQRRADAAKRRREPHDRAYHESRALYPLRRGQRAARGPPCRHRPHHSRRDGARKARGDGRSEPYPPLSA